MLNSPKRAQGGFSPLQPSGVVSDLKCNISTALSTRCKPRYARLYREYDFIFLGAQVKVHESNKSHRMGCRYAVITPFARLKGRIRLEKLLGDNGQGDLLAGQLMMQVEIGIGLGRGWPLPLDLCHESWYGACVSATEYCRWGLEANTCCLFSLLPRDLKKSVQWPSLFTRLICVAWFVASWHRITPNHTETITWGLGPGEVFDIKLTGASSFGTLCWRNSSPQDIRDSARNSVKSWCLFMIFWLKFCAKCCSVSSESLFALRWELLWCLGCCDGTL